MEHREDEDNGGVVSNIDRPQDNLDLMQSPDDSLQLDEYRYDRTRGAGTSSSLLRAPSLETAGSTSSIPISGDDRVVSNIDRLQDNLDLMYARAEVGVVVVRQLRAAPERTPRDADHDGQGRSGRPLPDRRERGVLTSMVEQRRVVWWRVTAEAGEVGVHVGHDGAGARLNGGKFQEVAGGRGG